MPWCSSGLTELRQIILSRREIMKEKVIVLSEQDELYRFLDLVDVALSNWPHSLFKFLAVELFKLAKTLTMCILFKIITQQFSNSLH